MIREILEHGEENATPTSHLMGILGCSRREIVSTVSEERAQGAPILSSSRGGYYLPDKSDPEKALSEIRCCIATITNRGRRTIAAVKELRKEEERLEYIVSGQEKLEV